MCTFDLCGCRGGIDTPDRSLLFWSPTQNIKKTRRIIFRNGRAISSKSPSHKGCVCFGSRRSSSEWAGLVVFVTVVQHVGKGIQGRPDLATTITTSPRPLGFRIEHRSTPSASAQTVFSTHSRRCSVLCCATSFLLGNNNLLRLPLQLGVLVLQLQLSISSSSANA